MVTIQPFTLEIIKTHKCFYLLQHISNVQELQILHNTPAGHIETTVFDAFYMPNGKIVVACNHAFLYSTMHNVVAISGQIVENINLTALERVIDIYDRPVDASIGVFSFTNSDMVIAPHRDWRCDNGKFGPFPFANPEGIFEAPSGIVVYEPVLSVNGVGHLVYVEGVGKQDLANAYLNADTSPVTGRTLWETLKLIREWAIVNLPPFNNNDATSLKARLFLKELQLTDAELAVIDSQIPMQIANYLSGSTNARQRPDGVLPLTNDVKNILFSRLASGSISALEYMNPGMWNLEELLNVEKEQLLVDIRHLFANTPPGMGQSSPTVVNTRYLNNKQLILDKVENHAL